MLPARLLIFSRNITTGSARCTILDREVKPAGETSGPRIISNAGISGKCEAAGQA
jgi:hypothetical protein